MKELIKGNSFNIVFGNPDIDLIYEAFSIPKDNSNASVFMYIRNKCLDGSDGKPINHYCTVKLIKNNIYVHDGHKGVPFKVEPKIELDVDYSIDRKDEKFAKKFIKDNKQDILDYWKAKDTKEGRATMKEIENKICEKYGVKLNEQLK